MHHQNPEGITDISSGSRSISSDHPEKPEPRKSCTLKGVPDMTTSDTVSSATRYGVGYLFCDLSWGSRRKAPQPQANVFDPAGISMLALSLVMV